MIKTPERKTDLHYGNVPILSYKWNDLTIEGYSQAAVQTYWRFPEFKLLVDHGAHSRDFAGVGDLCLTHMHPDHCAGLFSYLSSRSVLNTPPPRIFLHPDYESNLRELITIWERMTSDHLPCEIIPCESGDRFSLGQGREIEVFSTSHVIPCQGYIINQVHHKLMPDFENLSGEEIKNLRAEGIEVQSIKRTPRIAICGDTTIDVFKMHPKLRDVEILIIEITFIDDSVDRNHARKFGHVHFDDFIIELAHLRNHLIIGTHFSTRLSRSQSMTTIERKLPAHERHRFVAWL